MQFGDTSYTILEHIVVSFPCFKGCQVSIEYIYVQFQGISLCLD